MKTPATPRTSYLEHRLPVAVLWAAILLAYSNSFQAGLVFDSASRILDDPRVHSATAENLRLIFQSDYWHPDTGSGLYRPLTTLSFLFNYAVLGNGGAPFGYHAVNWLLHALNASLVYFLALRMLKQRAQAFAVAVLWAVHPVLTESVTNVVGRADLLAGAGVLGGLLAYIRGKWIIAAVAVTIAAFSKESAIVILAAAFLYDLWTRRKPVPVGYAALALPFMLFWIVRALVFAGAPARVVPFTDNPIAGAGWVSAKLTAVKVLGKELLLMLWPVRLSNDYSYNQIPLSSPSDWQAWTALAACLALAAAAVIFYRKREPAGFWIAFTLLALVPTSNLAVVIGAPMAERFLYLPAIGVAGCLVAAAPRGRTGDIALAVLAILFAARSFIRNFDWKDERSLWTSAATASPSSYKVHMTLGALHPPGDPAALRETEAAIAIVDRVPQDLNTAIPFINAGKLHRQAGAYDKALEVLRRASHIRASQGIDMPGGDQLFAELGRVHAKLSRFDEAATSFREALRGFQSPELFEELSAVYRDKGDLNQAAIAGIEGSLTYPRNSRLASEVARLYLRIDPAGCAMQSVNGQIGLNLGCPMVHGHFCAAAANLVRLYRENGQTELANQTHTRAVDTLHCDPRLESQ